MLLRGAENETANDIFVSLAVLSPIGPEVVKGSGEHPVLVVTRSGGTCRYNRPHAKSEANHCVRALTARATITVKLSFASGNGPRDWGFGLLATGFAIAFVPGVRRGIVIAGAAMALLGVALLIIALAREAYARLLHLRVGRLKKLKDFLPDFREAYLSRDGISELYTLEGGLLELLTHTPRHVLQARLARNPQLVRVAYSTADSRMIAVVIMYPLTANCGQRILDGSLTASAEFHLDDITRTFREARAIYVSLVLGVGRRKGEERAAAVFMLKDRMVEILHQNSRIEHVFARPTTPEGLERVRGYGLRPLNAMSDLYYASREMVIRNLRRFSPEIV